MKNKIVVLLFCVILLIAAFLRLFMLSSVPNGLQQDETSIGYNALSIVQTGKDEYGKSFPLSFKAFGEYKLPLSIYLTSASFALFGVSDFTLRLTSAIFGILTVVVVFFLTLRITKSRQVAFIAMGLLAINPWHLHFSRGAYEVTPALFCITLGIYLFLVFLKKNSSYLLSLSLIFFALSMYGYNIARLFVPLLLILLGVFYLKKNKQLPKKIFAMPLIVFLIFILPFLYTVFTSGGYQSTKGTLITTSASVQAANLETRSYINQENHFISKILFNSVESNAVYYVKNIASYLNAEFFFVNGSTHGNHGIGNVGQFYIFELIFIILGIVFLIRSKNNWNILLFGWVGLVIAVASLTREAPHATRAYFMVVPLTIISAIGFYEIIKKVRNLHMNYRFISVIALFGIFLYFVFYYMSSYYFRFPVFYAKNYRSEDRKLVKLLQERYDKYDVIYVDNEAQMLYTSILFYSQFDASEFQKSVFRAKDDSEGFSRVTSFGKYEYVDVDNFNPQQKSLLISTREIPGFEVIERFNYPSRPVVIAKGQEIVSFPVEDVAYVLLEKN
ncbi:MAG: glycosyltransferase family 39 protein [Candidatus Levybacteria bacterium]|nr:glycosyltransferase family 39 protein [Candidatus Levybacteria bacterium]